MEGGKQHFKIKFYLNVCLNKIVTIWMPLEYYIMDFETLQCLVFVLDLQAIEEREKCFIVKKEKYHWARLPRVLCTFSSTISYIKNLIIGLVRKNCDKTNKADS